MNETDYMFRELFGEDSESTEDIFEELFGEGVEEGFSELFGEEEEPVARIEYVSNLEEWKAMVANPSKENNPELVNMNLSNPGYRVFYAQPGFDYSKDYSDLTEIFERFKKDLLKGEM